MCSQFGFIYSVEVASLRRAGSGGTSFIKLYGSHSRADLYKNCAFIS